MSQAPIPIVMSWQPLGTGIEYATIDELGEIIAAQMAASISTKVSFFAMGNVTPGVFVTPLFYNQAQNLFYGWNTGSAAYLPITQYTPGDTKTTFVAGDSPTTGWIVCDGRAITAVPNLSQFQVAILQNLFGAAGNLPNIQPVQSLVGLPTKGSFSGIDNPSVQPPTGQIGALTFSSPPAQTEVQALANNCENLDESAIATQTALAASIAQSEAMLDSLLAATPTGLVTKVFAGYP